jgi:aromatic-L-amino-acid decarboxylase
VAAFLDERNQALMEAVNRTGEVLLSHARLDGRFTIRVALGNLRTEDRHLRHAWDLLRREAARLDAERPRPTAA